MCPNIPAVIVLAERQRASVEKLVKYCRDLDGTIVNVLEAPGCTSLPYPRCNDASFHFAASTFKGQPFFWLEPDCIPLASGWLPTLSEQYYSSGKEFLLSSDSHPPDDLIGGIGVYGPNTHWLMPKNFQEGAWDLWMHRHMRPAIHFTPSIQHSYGYYFNGVAEPHRFPKDKHLLRSDALIFHRDKFQDLITPTTELEAARKEITMKHNGDIGDIIAALPILREIGGGKIILYHDPNASAGRRPRQSLEGERFESIKPLLEAQPYVTSVEWGEGVDANGFREVMRPKHESLTERQARHFGRWPIKLTPWLTVPAVEKHRRVVVARSPRYHSQYPFPWRDAYETYGDRLLFIGLPDEHIAFQSMLGHNVERAKTQNFLEIAQIMAGAPQVIANQSSPLWVALGLGTKIICEGHAAYPNSEVPRPGSFWAYTQEDMNTVRRAFATVRAKGKQ